MSCSGNKLHQKEKNLMHPKKWTDHQGGKKSEYVTMDYSWVRRRRPIHNKHVPFGPWNMGLSYELVLNVLSNNFEKIEKEKSSVIVIIGKWGNMSLCSFIMADIIKRTGPKFCYKLWSYLCYKLWSYLCFSGISLCSMYKFCFCYVDFNAVKKGFQIPIILDMS